MISRRMIVTGGAAVLALGAGGGAALVSSNISKSAASYRLYANGLRTALDADPSNLELVRYATLAPNGHNTQPWRFHLESGSVRILPDITRRTPVVDPDDHHLYVSLGCALENLVLAACVRRRPGVVVIDGDGADGAKFVFSGIGTAPEDAFRDLLFGAIPLRQTTRGLYDGKPVPAADLETLRNAAAVDDVDLAVLTERSIIDKARDLVIAANSVQMDDAAFRRELKAWIRFSPDRAMETGDGLYAASSGNPALPEALGTIAFPLAFTKSAENNKYAAQMDSSAGVAVFSAQTEGPAGWIAVGRACQRFCLMARVLGLRTAFVNQPVEVASFRADLASLAGIPGRRPDIMLRFGYGPALPYSPRRPVAAVIET